MMHRKIHNDGDSKCQVFMVPVVINGINNRNSNYPNPYWEYLEKTDSKFHVCVVDE